MKSRSLSSRISNGIPIVLLSVFTLSFCINGNAYSAKQNSGSRQSAPPSHSAPKAPQGQKPTPVSVPLKRPVAQQRVSAPPPKIATTQPSYVRESANPTPPHNSPTLFPIAPLSSSRPSAATKNVHSAPSGTGSSAHSAVGNHEKAISSQEPAKEAQTSEKRASLPNSSSGSKIKSMNQAPESKPEAHKQIASGSGANSHPSSATEARAGSPSASVPRTIKSMNAPKLSALSDPPKADPGPGVIYLRTSESGGEYIGQSKSLERFEERQIEERRAKPGETYNFKTIDRGKEGTDLRIKEQQKINEYGGLQKDGGPLENKRNEIARDKWGEYNIKDPAKKSTNSNSKKKDDNNRPSAGTTGSPGSGQNTGQDKVVSPSQANTPLLFWPLNPMIPTPSLPSPEPMPMLDPVFVPF